MVSNEDSERKVSTVWERCLEKRNPGIFGCFRLHLWLLAALGIDILSNSSLCKKENMVGTTFRFVYCSTIKFILLTCQLVAVIYLFSHLTYQYDDISAIIHMIRDVVLMVVSVTVNYAFHQKKIALKQLLYDIGNIGVDIFGYTEETTTFRRIRWITNISVIFYVVCVFVVFVGLFGYLQEEPILMTVFLRSAAFSSETIYIVSIFFYITFNLIIIVILKELRRIVSMPLATNNLNEFKSGKHHYHWDVGIGDRRNSSVGDPLIFKWMTYHQKLCQIVCSAEEIFRELNLIWTINEFVTIPLGLRMLDIKVPMPWRNDLMILIPLTMPLWAFVCRTFCGEYISHEVSTAVINSTCRNSFVGTEIQVTFSLFQHNNTGTFGTMDC